MNRFTRTITHCVGSKDLQLYHAEMLPQGRLDFLEENSERCLLNSVLVHIKSKKELGRTVLHPRRYERRQIGVVIHAGDSYKGKDVIVS